MRTMELPVVLTDDEVRQKGERIARLLEEMDAADAAFASDREAYKSKKSRLDDELRKMSRQVRSRTEPREVEVHEVRCYDRYVVETVRIDTGEVISTRGMTVAERQKPIDFPRPVEAGAASAEA